MRSTSRIRLVRLPIRLVLPWLLLQVSPDAGWPAQVDEASKLDVNQPAFSTSGDRVVRAGTTSRPIRLDGILDDTEWSQAGIIPDLEQAEPHPGEPTPFRTQVLVLVDSEALYLGFNCTDPQPEKISIHTLQRDASLDADDYVVVTLDSFGDHRTGYF